MLDNIYYTNNYLVRKKPKLSILPLVFIILLIIAADFEFTKSFAVNTANSIYIPLIYFNIFCNDLFEIFSLLQ